MRSPIRRLVAAVVVAVAAVASAADPLLGVPPAPRPADPLLAPPALPACPEPPPEADDHWRVAVDFGLPMGVRVQRRLGDSPWWAEAGVGAWVIVPYASACLRYDVTLLKRERNLFAVRPGVSATCVLFGPNLGVGIDCEFLWQHTFARYVTCELGVRAGMTAVIPSRQDRCDSSRGPFPAPVLCLMWAWQF